MDISSGPYFPFPWVATSLLFIIAISGSIVNCYLLVKFSAKSGTFSAFDKLCLVKTAPNIVVCVSFLAWTVPLSVLPQAVPARLPNVIVGQVAGAGAYVLGPLIQVCMAANRFLILYFPLRQMRINKSPITSIALSCSMVISLVYTVAGLPEECGYIYDPPTFTWIPEPFECAETELEFLTYTVFILASISNGLAVLTAAKLLCFQKILVGISRADATRRRKRSVMMFVQSAVQDCLHVVDLLNCTYVYTLSDDPWFQFVFLTVSFVLIYALDGFVMFYFHPEVYPSFFQSRRCLNKCMLPVLFTKVSTI